MKHIALIALLLPMFAVAQNCELKTTKDPYTKEITVSTGLVALNNAQYSIEAKKTGIDFMFLIDGKCYDDASTASVFFDSTRVKANFRNSGAMNCDGLFHFYFRNTATTASQLQNLATKKVTAIRFKDNSNKETGVNFTADQQQVLKQFVACIISESKKLL